MGKSKDKHNLEYEKKLADRRADRAEKDATSLESSHAAAVRKLEAEISDLQAQIAKKERKEMQVSSESIRELQRTLKTESTKARRLEAELAEEVATRDRIQAQIAKAKAACEENSSTSEGDIAAKATAIQDFEDKIRSVTAEIDKTEKKKGVLEKRVAELAEEKGQLEAKTAELDKKIKDLQAEKLTSSDPVTFACPFSIRAKSGLIPSSEESEKDTYHVSLLVRLTTETLPCPIIISLPALDEFRKIAKSAVGVDSRNLKSTGVPSEKEKNQLSADLDDLFQDLRIFPSRKLGVQTLEQCSMIYAEEAPTITTPLKKRKDIVAKLNGELQKSLLQKIAKELEEREELERHTGLPNGNDGASSASMSGEPYGIVKLLATVDELTKEVKELRDENAFILQLMSPK